MYGERYTQEQEDWILENAALGIFKSQKHFTDVFNAIFGTNHTVQAMNTHVYRRGIVVKTEHHKRGCSEDQKKWLIDNFDKYDLNFVAMAADFNKRFGTNKSNCCIAKYCERKLGLHVPAPKAKAKNTGRIKRGDAGASTDRQLPIGTVRAVCTKHRKVPYIKVQLCNGDSGMVRGNGHNYKRPWWIPLREKVWIDAYGEIPNGYCVVNIDGDPMNCQLDNLMLMDKRGTAIMASHKWWMDDKNLTENAVTWCNLYLIAKDERVVV